MQGRTCGLMERTVAPKSHRLNACLGATGRAAKESFTRAGGMVRVRPKSCTTSGKRLLLISIFSC
ncbi:MAG: hypothetical protein QOI13_1804 [Paraburkholderia sp.]|nr:hypothetical protein [Paraburkholderia sp.]